MNFLRRWNISYSILTEIFIIREYFCNEIFHRSNRSWLLRRNVNGNFETQLLKTYFKNTILQILIEYFFEKLSNTGQNLNSFYLKAISLIFLFFWLKWHPRAFFDIVKNLLIYKDKLYFLICSFYLFINKIDEIYDWKSPSFICWAKYQSL